MSDSLKKQAIKGVIWTFAQQFSIQLINFGVQIILARLLMPEEFGLIAMLAVFIALGQTLMDGGMTTSLIRTKKVDKLDYSTVFVSNIGVSLFIYLILFFCSPYIGAFYDQPILTNIIKLYALTFVIRSFVAVHVAKLTKEMNFKLQTKLQIPSTIVGAIVGVILAYFDFGVWSLVWLNLAQTTIFTIQHWLFIKWKPSLIFNKRRFKYHFNFGYKMTLSGLIDTLYTNSYNIVIGKFFLPATVGFYNQAETMRLLPVGQLTTVMGKVTFPLFTKINNDLQLKSAYKSSMRLVLFPVIPIMIYLVIVAEELFVFLFGEKWLPAVPYFQILSFASIVRPISNYNLNILKVKGKSGLLLKVEIIKKSIGVIAMIIALPFGIDALVISLLIVSYIFVIINMFYCGRLINYSVIQQIKDIGNLFISGFIAGIICYYSRAYLINHLNNDVLLMGLIGVLSLTIFLLIVYIIDREIFHIVKKILKK